jgi:hypothetical protein
MAGQLKKMAAEWYVYIFLALLYAPVPVMCLAELCCSNNVKIICNMILKEENQSPEHETKVAIIGLKYNNKLALNNSCLLESNSPLTATLIMYTSYKYLQRN